MVKDSKKQLRVFGMTSGIAIGVMFGLVLPLLLHRPLPYWPWVAATFLVGGALVFPSLLYPLHRIMQFAGTVIFTAVNWILLGVFYYLFFMPYSLILRLAGKGEFERKFREDVESYRVENKNDNPVDFERPF